MTSGRRGCARPPESGPDRRVGHGGPPSRPQDLRPPHPSEAAAVSRGPGSRGDARLSQAAFARRAPTSAAARLEAGHSCVTDELVILQSKLRPRSHCIAPLQGALEQQAASPTVATGGICVFLRRLGRQSAALTRKHWHVRQIEWTGTSDVRRCVPALDALMDTGHNGWVRSDSAGAAICLLPARTTVATTVPTVTQTRPKASLNKGT